MKTKYTRLFFAAILMISCSSNSETKNTNEDKIEENTNVVAEKKAPERIDIKLILGRWKTDFDGTVAQLTEEKKQKMAEVLPQFKQTFEGIIYEYKENGVYLHNGGIAPVEGMTKWKISDNRLEIKEGNTVVFSYEIVKLNENRMVLKSNNDDEIFPVTVYTKIN